MSSRITSRSELRAPCRRHHRALRARRRPAGPWPLTGDQIFAYTGGSRVINGVSDAQAAYRPDIAATQREAAVPQTSRYDSATVNGVFRWQGLVGLPKTGIVDATAWQTMTVR